MPRARKLSPLPAFDTPALRAALEDELGVKPRAVRRLQAALLARGGVLPTESERPEGMADDAWCGGWGGLVPKELPLRAARRLQADFVPLTSTLVERSVSADGTAKHLVRLQDGSTVEAVVMHYEGAKPGNGRLTLCVSSQVGCAMGCTFCATGTMGLKANLCAGEIVEQLVHATREAGTQIRNVVFMGMGEPLHNYAAVVAAVGDMVDTSLFRMSPSRVSVSTVGIVPNIKRMHDDMPGVPLALSLHAPNQELRLELVPTAKAYPLEKLMAAVDEHSARAEAAAEGAGGKTQEKAGTIFYEYVLIGGVNDADEHAHQLGELLKGRKAILNVIPWNATAAGGYMGYTSPPPGRIEEFSSIVKDTHGVFCTVRREMGSDIAGACGQLVVERTGGNRPRRNGGACSSAAVDRALADIEDLAVARG